MRIAYLVAGAGGMYCGACMRDNRLAATLIEQGRDVLLLPLYTPIRTDETDVSDHHIYYGGINVFLQQKSSLFRHTPWVMDRLLDAPSLLKSVGKMTAKTRAEDLGALTVSVLEGEHGKQQKELKKLIAGLKELKPSLIQLPNLMFVGVAKAIKDAIGVPVLCSLAGEDVFIDSLPGDYRTKAIELITACAENVDSFLTPTQYYRDYVTSTFGIPTSRIENLTMGINTTDFEQATLSSEPAVIGYLARICPEKGLDVLCDAFKILRNKGLNCRLRIAGYLGEADQPFWQNVQASLNDAGLMEAVDFLGEVDRASKIEFYKSLSVFSVPATHHEPKGFYVIEALSSGVPVVLPNTGSFPEIVESTGGGILYDGGAPQLADALATLIKDKARCTQLGQSGRSKACELFSAQRMADQAWSIYEQHCSA